jgi:hypothetical protein
MKFQSKLKILEKSMPFKLKSTQIQFHGFQIISMLLLLVLFISLIINSKVNKS